MDQAVVRGFGCDPLRVVPLLLIALMTTGCGGGGSSGTTTTTTASTGSIRVVLDTSVGQTLRYSTMGTERVFAVGDPIISYRIRVLNPSTLIDLVAPVIVARSGTALTQEVTIDGVPVGPVKVLVEALDGGGVIIGHAQFNTEPQATGTPSPVTVPISPGPLPPITPATTPTPVPSGSPTPTPTPVPQPDLLTVNPATGTLAGGTAVTLTGTDFGTSPLVTFGGVTATNIVVTGGTQITCVTPAGANAIPVDVVVATGSGTQDTLAGGYTYNNFPTITTVLPVAGGPLAGGTSVTIDGTGFLGTVTVQIGGIPATNVIVTGGTQITCTTPSTVNPGAKSVVVTSSTNGSVTRLNGFTYNPLPTLSGVLPTVGGPLAGNTPLTILGTNFGTTATVLIGGNPATNVTMNGSTSLTCFSPAGTIGQKDVVVTFPTHGTATLTGGFSYNSLPDITQVLPAFGGPLVGGIPVTINGTNFGGSVNVTIGTIPATGVTVNQAGTQIRCVSPGQGAAIAFDVTVASSANGIDVEPASLTYNPTPTIASVGPATGVPLAGGAPVTVNGANLGDPVFGVANVTIGGQPATNVIIVSQNQVTCLSPTLSTTGSKDVTLGSTTNGTVTSLGALVYNPLPILDSPVVPQSGALAGSQRVTITGTDLLNVTSVSFGSTLASNLATTGGTTLTCDTPLFAAFAQTSITVTSSSHGVVSLDGAFTFNANLAFTTPSVTASARTITGMDTGDVDHDGDLDIVVCQFLADEVLYIPFDPVNGYDVAIGVPTDSFPFKVMFEDVNRDGNLDIVSGNSSSNTLSTCLGDGLGAFAAPTNIAIGVVPERLAAGDFDLDGDVDLAFTVFAGDQVGVVLNDGSGTFGAAAFYATGDGPIGLSVGDFDRDGDPDFVISNRNTNDISFKPGNGDGTFAAGTTTTTGDQPDEIAAGDLDRDGDLDVVACSNGQNQVSVLLGSGTGTFSGLTLLSSLFPRDVDLADFNGDTVLDIITIGNNSGVAPGRTTIFPGTGLGTFLAGVVFSGNGSEPFDLNINDFNRDGKPDIGFADFTSREVFLVPNTTPWPVPSNLVEITEPAIGALPGGLGTADFDRDGKSDLGSTNAGAGIVELQRGTGGRNFTAAGTASVGAGCGNILLADMNDDGRTDIVATRIPVGPQGVSVALGTGSGTFGAPIDVTIGDIPTSLAVGDFDRDGNLDLAVGDAGPTGAVNVLLGDGAGNLTLNATVNPSQIPGALAVGDFDIDGDADLAVAGQTDMTIFLGNGDGTFAAGTPVTCGDGANAMVSADFNRDGRPDLVTSDSNSNSVTVFLGDGTGVFPAGTSIPTGIRPRSVNLVDYDRDGKFDLLLSEEDTGLIVMIGDGVGGFPTILPFPSDDLPARLVAGDFNRDGLVDAAVSSTSLNKLTIHHGR